ncbi:tyrosine kinase [Schistosoma mansoni]|uniref:tyrosine kinase n=1 Tax=Schistosoma mansoni TaxID=6183 RepID=UPI0001A64492|nr:tyrosine kinase [Schistosoma mansoni]|eukprot:XP_018651381.1 tyrosine kinase [Schistosoma mansoni]
MLLIGFLFIILLLFDKSISKTSPNVSFCELKQNEHHHQYDILINNTIIELSCSFGNEWYIPSTIPLNFKPIVIMDQINNNQSKLLIQLPKNNTDNLRTHFRGLYQCCQSSNSYNISIINWLPNEPSCCPCCPWYEQDQCLFKQIQFINHSNIIFKLKSMKTYCGSVFLHMNSVTMTTIHLDIIRNQPMLIPCPGLNSTYQEDSSLFSIDYQLTPHKSSYQLWYPFKQFKHSIQYYYDNRFGLCLLKSQFPRIMLYMLCNYKQMNEQRIIQPIWPLQSLDNVKLSNISDFQEHYQIDEQSPWERTECLTTHQTFNKFSILYAYSKYDLDLSKTSNETNSSVNNTFILCEVTTPDRMAPISQRIIQIVKTTNQISNKLHISYHCNCMVLGDNKSSFSDNSTLSLLIKNNSVNLNISFWTEHETDNQPFCILMKHGMPKSEQKTKETQINPIRTKDTWKCFIKIKMNLPNQTMTLSIGYGEIKRTFQIFIVKSILELTRNVENLQSQITQQSYLHCIPNDMERSIAQRFGYHYPNHVTWFISMDNHIQNYTTYNKTFEHIFKLIPFYNVTNYPMIVLNQTGNLWERPNELGHLNNLYLNDWPKQLCVRCSSVYEIGIHFNSHESCTLLNDFNVIDIFNNTGNHRDLQSIRGKKQLYFVIELNNSSQFYEVNSHYNNSEISLVQSTFISLECIRKLYTKPEQFKRKEWPELTINNTQNNTEDHLIHNTSWILSPYSFKVKKVIHLNKPLVIHLKCAYKTEQYVIKIHTFKQNKPQILKPIENIQFIKTNLQQSTLFNYTIHTTNITKNSIELICQAIGLPKPTIQWMKAIYNHNKSFIKWFNVHTCSIDDNKVPFNISIKDDQQIQTCIYHLTTLKETLNQSHYQCLATNIADSLMNYEEVQLTKFYMKDNKMNTNDRITLGEYRLTVKEIYRFAYGIISGIVYLVKNYVIHRDLATRNILINHNYIPKISDFGLAVQMTPINGLTNDQIYNIDGEFNEDQLIDEYYRVLTPRKKLPLRILPPEALLQHKFYFSSDIWQYGLLLWELFHLEKREPFQEIKTFQELVGMLSEHNISNNKNNSTNCNSDISREMLKKKTNCQRLLPPSTLDRPILVNDELWEMMCQMWSYNPHKRPTAAQIHDKLKYLLEGTKEIFSCIDFQYNCHGQGHHKHHSCTYKNCKFLSDTSFIEVHNHSVHIYENTIQST